MTAVLPAPLRSVDEPRFVPVQVWPCPTCSVLLGGPLVECVKPGCVAEANTWDYGYDREVEDNR